MKLAVINSKTYEIINLENLTDDMIKRNDVAVKIDDNIYPVDNGINGIDGSVVMNSANDFMIKLPEIKPRVSRIYELPDMGDSQSISDIIAEKESSRDVFNEQISTQSADKIFHPKFSGAESPEMLILKQAIEAKNVDLNIYEDRFNGTFHNDIRLINKDNISILKMKSIADALDMEISMKIKDKSDSVANPMNKEFETIITIK